MGFSYTCPLCGNSDKRYIGIKNGKPYCRKCISFCGSSVEEEISLPKNVVLDLSYNLSAEQKELSDKVISNFKNNVNTLVYAVCGSGKTEISYGVIGYAMSKGYKVGFALPRRDVVIELYLRLKEAFPSNTIAAVYGGNSSILTADCLILTTHQLYRYDHYFDLLVMDEIDAFPFKGNDALEALFKRSCRGSVVMMSATPSQQIIKEFSSPGHDILHLYTRFHKHKIPVPKIIEGPLFVKYIKLLQKLRYLLNLGKPCFVFVPTIDLSKSLYRFLSLFLKGGNYVSSKKKDRAEVINAFRKGKLKYVVTTAVLERGVTIGDAQVFVFKADSKIYDKSALIQIAGRAGRKAYAPKGYVYFIADKTSKAMEEAISEIKSCNAHLQT